MKLLRSIGLAVLVMSSGAMVRAKNVKDMSEAEKDVYYGHWRKIALIEACIKGHLQYKNADYYHRPVLQYVGPCGPINRSIHENSAAEIRDILRESKEFLGINTSDHLYQAALKWHHFKECTDLEGKTGKAVERIKANRRAFLKAIDNAVAREFPKRDFDDVPAEPAGTPVWDEDRDSDEAKIAQAAKKTLHYKNPVIHRLQKLFGRKKNQS